MALAFTDLIAESHILAVERHRTHVHPTPYGQKRFERAIIIANSCTRA
jgi:hypothetical protein